MRLQHLGDVHAVDVVGPEDDDVVGILVIDEVEGLEDGIGTALEPSWTEPLLGWHRGDVVAEHGAHTPRLGDVTVQGVRFVLGEDGNPRQP